MRAAAGIRFAGITKRFPGVEALNDVSFEVAPGEVHAICGENGAGKSTLGRILAGVHQPDAGELQVDGQPVRFATPREALAAGIAMVHQELVFCDNLTVAENLCLGALPSRRGFLDRAELRRRALRLLAAVGGDAIDPARTMSTLGIAEQQVVQIAAAIGAGARAVIFDEPTSSLGDAEAERLFTLIAELKQRGVTVLYVSHRLPEIFRLSDTITVLRDGRHVVTAPRSAMDEATLVERIIGRRIEQYFPQHTRAVPGTEVLRVDRLSSPGKFHDVSFSLRAGEVLGLAGLVGAGRSEVAQAVFGLDPAARGRVRAHGAPLSPGKPHAALQAGIGFVPEDRKTQGLVLLLTARENTTLPVLGTLARWRWIARGRERAEAARHLDRLAVRRSAHEAPVVQLSGGTQQKVVLARWLAARSSILILDEPTRGVDVGAKAELHAWIDQLAQEGLAVLLISSELPELLNLATRILVLRGGRLVREIPRAAATQDGVLRAMAGLD